MTSEFFFGDFTEDGYRAALQLAKAQWKFESFGVGCDQPHLFWRHDVDMSPHRALRLAQIEHENGVKATYFWLLHSDFYSCFEVGIRDIVRAIRDLGHDVGLHFDSTFYGDHDDPASLERRINSERSVLEELAGTTVKAVSFHNPTEKQLLLFDQPFLADLVNAYGKPLRDGYRYVSDSNGHWRFHRLRNVLAAPAVENLHVLTHPEWWTPTEMAPRDRVARAVEGRARRVLQTYDKFLENQGRLNVR